LINSHIDLGRRVRKAHIEKHTCRNFCPRSRRVPAKQQRKRPGGLTWR